MPGMDTRSSRRYELHVPVQFEYKDEGMRSRFGQGAQRQQGELYDISIGGMSIITKKLELACKGQLTERTSITFRFLNTPYTEIPIKDFKLQEEGQPVERLRYIEKSFFLEIGRELNPAAIASLGFQYSPGSDVEFKEMCCEDVIGKLDGKPRFSVGVTFTVDIEVLAGMR